MRLTPRYVLGFDGGGSKAEAVLMDDSGAVLGHGLGGPAVAMYEGVNQVRESIALAAEEALAGGERPIAAMVASGPAGIEPAVEALAQRLKPERCRVTTEFDLVLAAHRLDWGLVILSGTGSGVFVRTPDGRSVHMGGSGPLIGDEGSAYEIGIRAIRAAVRAGYSEGRETSLAEAMPTAVGLERPKDLIGWVYVGKASRRQIASLARMVDQEAEAGDRIADAILRDAAGDLCSLAAEALTEAGLLRPGVPLAFAGSVAMKSERFRQHLLESLPEAARHPEVVHSPLSPAYGAALLALRDTGVNWTDDLFRRVEETAAT